MDYDYGQVYERLYKEHWWWRSREEFLMDHLLQLHFTDPISILDVGCGNGLFFDRLLSLGGSVEGIETDPHLVSSPKHRDQITIGSFDASFQPSKRYSFILMLDVLEHLSHPLEAVHRAAELLEPNGVLLVTVPAMQWLWTYHDEVNHHFRRYNKRSLQELVRGSPFKVERMEYFFHWLVPLKLAIRFKERWSPNRKELPTIPGARINQWLYAISRLEQRLFQILPIPKPIGTSLYAVLRLAKVR